jgi:hypothetical protein
MEKRSEIVETTFCSNHCTGRPSSTQAAPTAVADRPEEEIDQSTSHPREWLDRRKKTHSGPVS